MSSSLIIDKLAPASFCNVATPNKPNSYNDTVLPAISGVIIELLKLEKVRTGLINATVLFEYF